MDTYRNQLPIVIGGCHRSGTSLLRRLLDTHPDIFCGPEVKFFRDFHADYKDDRYSHIRFLSTARSVVTEEQLLDVVGKAYVELQELAAKNCGKRRWADKNPENVLYLDDWNRLLGDGWLFVHVVRSPLDTLASMKQAKFKLTFPAGLSGRIAFYKRYLQAGLDFEQTFPERYHRVVYEELVTEPERIMHELMHWLGERFYERQLAFADSDHKTGIEDPKVKKTRSISQASVGGGEKQFSFFSKKKIRCETADIWSRVDRDRRWF